MSDQDKKGTKPKRKRTAKSKRKSKMSSKRYVEVHAGSNAGSNAGSKRHSRSNSAKHNHKHNNDSREVESNFKNSNIHHTNTAKSLLARKGHGKSSDTVLNVKALLSRSKSLESLSDASTSETPSAHGASLLQQSGVIKIGQSSKEVGNLGETKVSMTPKILSMLKDKMSSSKMKVDSYLTEDHFNQDKSIREGGDVKLKKTSKPFQILSHGSNLSRVGLSRSTCKDTNNLPVESEKTAMSSTRKAAQMNDLVSLQDMLNRSRKMFVGPALLKRIPRMIDNESEFVRLQTAHLLSDWVADLSSTLHDVHNIKQSSMHKRLQNDSSKKQKTSSISESVSVHDSREEVPLGTTPKLREENGHIVFVSTKQSGLLLFEFGAALFSILGQFGKIDAINIRNKKGQFISILDSLKKNEAAGNKTRCRGNGCVHFSSRDSAHAAINAGKNHSIMLNDEPLRISPFKEKAQSNKDVNKYILPSQTSTENPGAYNSVPFTVFIHSTVAPMAISRFRDISPAVRAAYRGLLRALPRKMITSSPPGISINKEIRKVLLSHWSERRAMHRALILESHLLYTQADFDGKALEAICKEGVLAGETNTKADDSAHMMPNGLNANTNLDKQSSESETSMQVAAHNFLFSVLGSSNLQIKAKSSKALAEYRELLRNYVQKDGVLTTRWIAYLVSYHLCSNCLRSHLGNARDTFQGFERSLQHQQSQVEEVETDFIVSAQKMTLWVTDYLETQITLTTGKGCLAYDSVLVRRKDVLNCELHSASKKLGFSIRTNDKAHKFFLKNRQVCLDWFARLRPLLLRSALSSNSFEMAILHGKRRLSELAKELWATLAPKTEMPLAIEGVKRITSSINDTFLIMRSCVERGCMDIAILTGIEAWIRRLEAKVRVFTGENTVTGFLSESKNVTSDPVKRSEVDGQAKIYDYVNILQVQSTYSWTEQGIEGRNNTSFAKTSLMGPVWKGTMAYTLFMQASSEARRIQSAGIEIVSNEGVSMCRSALVCHYNILKGQSQASMQQSDRLCKVVAALRILNLVQRFSFLIMTPEISNLLDDIIHKTSLQIWLSLSAQLLARLDRGGKNSPGNPSCKSMERYLLVGLLQRMCATHPSVMVWSTVPTRGRGDMIYECLRNVVPNMVDGVSVLCTHLRAMAVTPAEKWSSLLLGKRRKDSIDSMNLLLRKWLRRSKNITLAETSFYMKYGDTLQKLLSSMTKAVTEAQNVAKRNQEKLSSLVAEAIRNSWRPLSEFGHSLRNSELAAERSEKILRSSYINKADASRFKDLMESVPLPVASDAQIVYLKDSVSWDEVDEQAPQWYEYMSSYNHTLDMQHGKKLGIRGLSDSLTILASSKKRPKQLWLEDSETGKKYDFLLKGNDQPEIDQRVMQLFDTMNGLLRCAQEGRSPIPGMRLRTYGVTNIGMRTGLFRWVKDQISIYSVYERWHYHLHHLHAGVVQHGGGGKAPVHQKNPKRKYLQNPTDDYFSVLFQEVQHALNHNDSAVVPLAQAILKRDASKSKLKQADTLKFSQMNAQALKVVISKLSLKQFKGHMMALANRPGSKRDLSIEASNKSIRKFESLLPKHISKQVFMRLSSRVPPSLLDRELFLSSVCPEERLAKDLVFARSLATSSIGCHVVGLGDRHLNNILVDLQSGSLMQVDLSIAFGRGMYDLKVPEVVPFRFTQVIRGALGITKEEGVFRKACENVLQTVRMGEELLTLLLEHTDKNTFTTRNASNSRTWSEEIILRINGKLRYPNDSENKLLNDDGLHDSYKQSSLPNKCDNVKKDMQGPATVSAQVTRLISAATSVENLSLMFEGWAAWI